MKRYPSVPEKCHTAHMLGYLSVMSDGVILLGEVAARAAVITVACRTCLRRGRLRTDQLLLTHGPHMPMPALLRILAGTCPRVDSSSISEQCDVHSPTLGELFRPAGSSSRG